MLRKIILPLLLVTTFSVGETSKEEVEETGIKNMTCFDHASYGVKLEKELTRDTFQDYELYRILVETFTAYSYSMEVCEKDSKIRDYALIRAKHIIAELQRLRPIVQANCTDTLQKGLNTVNILDTTLPLDVQYLMVSTSLQYFIEAEKACILNKEELELAIKYIKDTNEALKNLAIVETETQKLGILGK